MIFCEKSQKDIAYGFHVVYHVQSKTVNPDYVWISAFQRF